MTTPGPDGNLWSAPTAAPPGAAPGPLYGTPFGTPEAPPAPPSAGYATRDDVVAAVVAAGIMLLAGVPLGLLWGATVPTVDVADLLANNSESALEAQPAADARFALIAAVFGLVAGLLAGWRGRRAGWPLPVGLVAGGIGGSLIAAQVGHFLARQDVLNRLPATASPLLRDLVDVTVRADGVHAVLPFVAVLVFLLVVVTTTRPEPLQVPEQPPAGAWWSAPR